MRLLQPLARIHIDVRPRFRGTGSHTNVGPSRVEPISAIRITIAIAVAVLDANSFTTTGHQGR